MKHVDQMSVPHLHNLQAELARATVKAATLDVEVQELRLELAQCRNAFAEQKEKLRVVSIHAETYKRLLLETEKAMRDK